MTATRRGDRVRLPALIHRQPIDIRSQCETRPEWVDSPFAVRVIARFFERSQGVLRLDNLHNWYNALAYSPTPAL